MKSGSHKNMSDVLSTAYLLTDIAAQKSLSKSSSAGATSVTCVVRRDRKGVRHIYTANCGDARAVLSRGGSALRLSKVCVCVCVWHERWAAVWACLRVCVCVVTPATLANRR